MTFSVKLSPRDYGFPQAEWRPRQRETIDRIVNSDRPVIFLSAPTGAGKSLIGVGAGAVLENERIVIATKTIQLQDQYVRDFSSLQTMMGRANFTCFYSGEPASQAPCSDGGFCDLWGRDECDYYAARNKAAMARFLVTNFDYLVSCWKGRHTNYSPIRNRTIAIFDEAHLLDDSLRSATSAQVSRQTIRYCEEVLKAPPPRLLMLDAWAEWATKVQQHTQDAVRAFSAYKDLNIPPDVWKKLRRPVAAHRVASQVKALVASGSQVVVVRNPDGTATVEPLWADEAFRMLMEGFRKIVLMSATLPSPTVLAELLGLTEDEYEVIDLPSAFPVAQRPFKFHPVCSVSKQKMSEADIDRLVGWVDHYLTEWADRKGLVHTHAYWLQKILEARSQWSNTFITHGARGLPGAIARFVGAASPAWLVSPTAHSGVDLPDDQIRGQIILKLPTPDLSHPVIAARREERPETYDLAIAATIIQAYGRAMRSPDDWGETVMLDSNFGWFYKRNAHLFPGWFREAVQVV